MSSIIRRANMTKPIPLDFSKMYMTFEIIHSGTVMVKTNGSIGSKTFYYSLNGGSWTEITSSASSGGKVTIGTFSVGDIIRFKGENEKYATSNSNYMNFEGGSAYFNIYGNIMSMLYDDEFEDADTLPSTYCFCSMFKLTNCRSAKNLVLPVLTLTEGCYRALFSKSLCNVAPEILPATTLASYCYWYMFEECRFEKAPILPFTGTVPTYGYGNMFTGCTNLSYVKCLATDVSKSNAVTNWLNNVYFTGTFVKNYNMNSWSTGASGIPSGWTVLSGDDSEISWTRQGYVLPIGMDSLIKLLNPHNLSVTFSSSNPDVARIDSSGNVTLISEGASELTASFVGNELYYAKDATCVVNVSNDYAKQYFTIVSESDENVISLNRDTSGNEYSDILYIKIEISTDNGRTWTTKQSTDEGTVLATLYAGDKLLIKANNSFYASYDYGYEYTYFSSTGNFHVEGNIMSLLYGDNFDEQYNILEYGSFVKLFYECTHLMNASNLVLPATKLKQDCYTRMFNECTSLVNPPAILPSFELITNCYYGMFEGCTSLTHSPLLPATTLVDSCYSNMFKGCSSLNNIKCFAIDNINENSTTNCWVEGVAVTGTFAKDSSTTWPTGDSGIPTGWTIIGSVNSEISWGQPIYSLRLTGSDKPTFSNPNNLPVTFSSSDSSVATIDSSGNVTFVDNGECELSATFAGDGTYCMKTATCTLMLSENYTERYFTILSKVNNNEITYRCTQEFYDAWPEKIPTFCVSTNGSIWIEKTATVEGVLMATLNKGERLMIKLSEYAINGLADYNDHEFRYVSFGSTGDFDVEGNIKSLLTADNFVTYEVHLNYNDGAFTGLFENCTHLINACNLVLPTELGASCYYRMFSGCTSLITPPELPATTLTHDGVYSYMFENCTSLTMAPILPATTLSWGCYYCMFSGCTNLNYVKCLATNISAMMCTDDWLKNVSPSGTFVKNSSMSSWKSGDSGIPSGWNVQDA